MRGDPVSDAETLATRAARAARASERAGVTDPPADAAARRAARDGLGPVVACYIEARVSEEERVQPRDLDLLNRATEDWLAVYARHLGVDCAPSVPVRVAAETLLDTRNIVSVARVLTGVPARQDPTVTDSAPKQE